jgi:hypothetical protein
MAPACNRILKTVSVIFASMKPLPVSQRQVAPSAINNPVIMDEML